MQAIDEIVPTLLRALEDDQTSDTALDGLKQILRFDFQSFVTAFFLAVYSQLLLVIMESICCSMQC